MKQPVTIDRKCWMCKTDHVIAVEYLDWVGWKFQGVYAQNAFPFLDDGQRELLISGTCGPCFDEMFTEEAA